MNRKVIAVVAMATWLVGCQQAETTNGVDLSETSPVDETVETEEVETEDVEKEEAEAEEGEEVEEGGETAEEEAGVSEEGDVATGEVEAEPAEAPSSTKARANRSNVNCTTRCHGGTTRMKATAKRRAILSKRPTRCTASWKRGCRC